MKVLHLTLKKKWFDMIASGEKKEEYREIKPYWATRLLYGFSAVEAGFVFDDLEKSYPTMKGGTLFDAVKKDIETVKFTNGYGKSAPSKTFECTGLELRTGKPEWGAEPRKKYFVIKLGKQL